MCFNCGCELPADDMGHPESAITEDTFKKAAAAFGQTVTEAKQETLKLLKKQLEESNG